MDTKKPIQFGKESQKINVDISQKQKTSINDLYVRDLFKLLATHNTIPTHTPKKLIDCFYLYHSGSTYELYLYISNSWKKVSLT